MHHRSAGAAVSTESVRFVDRGEKFSSVDELVGGSGGATSEFVIANSVRLC